MGAWGTGPFDNDTAVDWSYGLEGETDLHYLEAALDTVLELGGEYIESDDAEEAIAAADTLARLLGHPGPQNAYSEAADKWVASITIKPTQDITAKAIAVLARIQQPPSDLIELWSESDDFANWKSSLADLASRLKS